MLTHSPRRCVAFLTGSFASPLATIAIGEAARMSELGANISSARREGD